ncbi:DENN domain-containing 5B [Gossypium australe]|uniref:DENN domain-containing 5B n=1 Tax=Gossypium australe TaxID=47621 RepID=A0A5B6UQ39_9ROSI|nr:DENN domain-containing 5B [Gossypium australe]
METKEEAEGNEDHPPSPSWELNHLFEVEEEEDVKGDIGVAQNPEPSGSSNYSRLPPLGHRRTQSDVLNAAHRRNNSFQRLKTSMQKALRWGGNSRDDRFRSSFNPEVLANQKRQWYQLHSKSMDKFGYEQPTSIFEHFIIAGVHPDTDLGTVEEAFGKRKKWETDMKRSGMIDVKMLQNHGPPLPIFEPQILFRYPPGKRLAMRLKDLATFCFPGGVKARLLERTPSFSELNEVLYGQEHLSRDDFAFIFSLKVAGNATVYGVCLHVPELVQRQPGNLGGSSGLSSIAGSSRQYMVSAPRCYCLLTRVPFFELHYEMLNSIIAQERLNRITEVVSEMNPSLDDLAPSSSKQDDQINDNTVTSTPNSEYVNEWMASALPVNSTVVLSSDTAANDEVSSASLKISSPLSSGSVAASDASDWGHVREIEKDVRKGVLYIDDNASEASEIRCSALERINGTHENGQISPDIGSVFSLRSRTSSQSLFSPARSLTSEDDEEEDDLFWNNEKEYGDDLIMEWAKENKNDLLQIVCSYHALALPQRGSEIVFQPLEHLQAIEYVRPPISALAMDESFFYSMEPSEINAKFAAAEEALALSVWTTATICRVLSLDGILAVIAGVLLEKQVVVVCPNLGVLSAVVLSLIPIIRPFQWQSLLLPVLPMRMLDFLDAPVPFLVSFSVLFLGVEKKNSTLFGICQAGQSFYFILRMNELKNTDA